MESAAQLGLGAGLNANPAGNVPLAATGYVGFWLRTDDAGVTVQLGIDDSVRAGLHGPSRKEPLNRLSQMASGISTSGTLKTTPTGSRLATRDLDGEIDATAGTVTIDSIFFSGAGTARIWLDTISHNPDGPPARCRSRAALGWLSSSGSAPLDGWRAPELDIAPARARGSRFCESTSQGGVYGLLSRCPVGSACLYRSNAVKRFMVP